MVVVGDAGNTAAHLTHLVLVGLGLVRLARNHVPSVGHGSKVNGSLAISIGVGFEHCDRGHGVAVRILGQRRAFGLGGEFEGEAVAIQPIAPLEHLG